MNAILIILISTIGPLSPSKLSKSSPGVENNGANANRNCEQWEDGKSINACINRAVAYYAM